MRECRSGREGESVRERGGERGSELREREMLPCVGKGWGVAGKGKGGDGKGF